MTLCWCSLLFGACGPADPSPEDGVSELEAVRLAPDRPAEAAERCEALGDPARRAHCMEQVVRVQAPKDPEGALSACGRLDEDLSGECFFVVAERAGRPDWCGRAGEHAFRCQMHVLSGRFASWIPKGSSPGDVEDPAVPRIREVGLDPEDPRPWSAVWRWVLGSQQPLDRASCSTVRDPMRREACEATGVAVFHDHLSNLLDLGTPLCEGDLPDTLVRLPDPVLEAALAERRASDLCDPDARRAPPPSPQLPGSGP